MENDLEISSLEVTLHLEVEEKRNGKDLSLRNGLDTGLAVRTVPIRTCVGKKVVGCGE